MKISILISSYNGKKDIPLFLDSIENLSAGCHELEVIIRDDNSTDGTAELISKNFPWVRLIRGSKNIGFAKSNNAAITNATGDIICCVNQDTILDPDFLIEGLAIFEKYPETVGINTNMIMPWVLSFEDFKKRKRADMPAYEYQLTPYGFAQYVEVDPMERETNFMTGGGFFLRREALLEDEELFDSSIHMYCEDTELSLRLTKRGGKIMYAPKAVIYHNQKKNKISSFNEFNKLIKITWIRFQVLSKHHPPTHFLKNYPLYLWGIVKKMDYIGLTFLKKIPAYIVGMCIAMVFFPMLFFWLQRSISHSKNHPATSIQS